MSLHISSVELENFKKFTRVNVNLHSGLCVFVGDNGGGKTSILEALTILISSLFPLCRYVPRISSMAFESDFIRAWYDKIQKKSSLTYAESSLLKCVLKKDAEDDEKSSIVVQCKRTGTKRSLAMVADLAKCLQEPRLAQTGIPTFAYYGAHRGAAQGDRKRFGRRKVDYTNPCAAYINALKPSLDFDLFLEWFSEEEHAEFIVNKRQKNYVSKELDAVRRAISKVFENSPIKYTEPHFEVNPKRFVMMQETSNGEVLPLPFDNLSDGYRAMIALVADFARRLAIANRYTETDPLLGEGVLLIDEIDAHLHPKWQYRVIEDLRRTFPNVQLIVTTHSAEVVSTVDKESVYVLEPDGGILEEKHPEEQTKGDYTDYIGGTVMGIPDNMDKHPEFKAYMNCLACIQEGNVEGDFFESEHQKVLKAYGENHHFVREINARMEGLRKKKEMMSRLKSLRK